MLLTDELRAVFDPATQAKQAVEIMQAMDDRNTVEDAWVIRVVRRLRCATIGCSDPESRNV